MLCVPRLRPRDVLCAGAVVLICSQAASAHPPPVWVQETRHLTFDVEGLESLRLATENGEVKVRGAAPDRGEAADRITIVARLSAGGVKPSDAHAALKAIDVRFTRRGTKLMVGDEWRIEARSHWRRSVAYEITLPPKLALDIETRNANVLIESMRASCHARTHNGSVTFRDQDGDVNAQTFNGTIDASLKTGRFTLRTHDGSILVAIKEATDVRGEITTHKGPVMLDLPDEIDVDISIRQRRGLINDVVAIRVPSNVRELSRTDVSLKVRLGRGGGEIVVDAHNATVDVE